MSGSTRDYFGTLKTVYNLTNLNRQEEQLLKKIVQVIVLKPMYFIQLHSS